jgi:hypothetical protein
MKSEIRISKSETNPNEQSSNVQNQNRLGTGPYSPGSFEFRACTCNILHICDYESGYDDLTPSLDYPGDVVNCSLKPGEQTRSPRAVSRMFGRPFMDGMERKGVVATVTSEEIRKAQKAYCLGRLKGSSWPQAVLS